MCLLIELTSKALSLCAEVTFCLYGHSLLCRSGYAGIRALAL